MLRIEPAHLMGTQREQLASDLSRYAVGHERSVQTSDYAPVRPPLGNLQASIESLEINLQNTAASVLLPLTESSPA
jgi:hypothetical protein